MHAYMPHIITYPGATGPTRQIIRTGLYSRSYTTSIYWWFAGVIAGLRRLLLACQHPLTVGRLQGRPGAHLSAPSSPAHRRTSRHPPALYASRITLRYPPPISRPKHLGTGTFWLHSSNRYCTRFVSSCTEVREA